ncbi:THO complex subunit 4A isoform X2 [Vitis riparia]|uniref:THO complex subunit 4A isoform X2 n=1 Tax=Vitis riparia TaxID=96939 RepID=UPI00155A23C1|nr:THO complex subunit 4A isoform X2 [Vitis riparia]
MSNALDMSLDDLIKNNKRSGGGGNARGRGRGSGPGPARRLPNRGANRITPYSVSKAPETAWQHDMFADQAAAYPAQAGRTSAIETGTKLYISNLDYGVSNEDIKELFSEVGDLKRYSIHYDRSGRSKGTAEVVFSRRGDAVAAVKRYNNVQLDGKPMKIEIVGTNIATPAAVPPVTNGTFGNSNGGLRSAQGRGGSQGRPRGGSGGRGFGRGRGRGRGGRGEKVSAEDLDADLEKYHSEAMQIN